MKTIKRNPSATFNWLPKEIEQAVTDTLSQITQSDLKEQIITAWSNGNVLACINHCPGWKDDLVCEFWTPKQYEYKKRLNAEGSGVKTLYQEACQDNSFFGYSFALSFPEGTNTPKGCDYNKPKDAYPEEVF